MYIGINGFLGDALFSVVATVSNTTSAILLLDGQSVQSNVTVGSYGYFYAIVNVPANATYSVYVRALAGDPDLFAR